MRRARAPWLAVAGVALLATISVGSPARAHTRSQSFSTWDVRAGDVVAVFSVPALEVARLSASAGEATDLAGVLRAQLSGRLSVTRANVSCTASEPRALAARSGYLRMELRFACAPRGALRIVNNAFFDVLPAHLHYARIRIDDAPAVEEIFKDGQRDRTLGSDGGTPTNDGASFGGYVVLGIEHIATGADHVAFLLALLLLCRRLRDVAFLVTGFTVGHSLTLTLAVLGVVRPEVPVVEALIGFTIALVAAENVGVGAHAQQGLSFVVAGAVVVLGLATSAIGAGLPFVVTLGLALFVVCYLPLTQDREQATKLRPLLTLLFGLVHGFGFASVLLDVGLPPGRLASALFGFNLGVEVGQLMIVASLWGAGTYAARHILGLREPRLALDLLSASLCALGLFWFVGRSVAL